MRRKLRKGTHRESAVHTHPTKLKSFKATIAYILKDTRFNSRESERLRGRRRKKEADACVLARKPHVQSVPHTICSVHRMSSR